MDFETKDSGERVEFPSGMRRDIDTDKPRYDLVSRLGLHRLAGLMARGATKYGDRNWELACTPEEVTRFQASAFRHFIQWLNGERDEDHASAVVFNVWAATETEEKLRNLPPEPPLTEAEAIARFGWVDVPLPTMGEEGWRSSADLVE